MGSTVQEVEMILPDGSLITASRPENVAISAVAMGGYGLIGQITSLLDGMRRFGPIDLTGFGPVIGLG
jgi:hypothetical protein